MWRFGSKSRGVPAFVPNAPEHALVERARLTELLENALGEAADEGRQVGVLVILVAISGAAELEFDAGREDRVLKHTTERTTRVVRASDAVTAIARNEICVVLPGLGGVEQAELAAMKLLGAIDGSVDANVELRASIGIACGASREIAAAELIRGARMGARMAGTRSPAYAVYDEALLARSADVAALSAPLRRALENNDLHLEFQPQIEIADGRVSGAEALVRWTADAPIPPGRFIPIVEQTGAIAAFTGWLLHASLRELSRVREAGIDLSISINVSPLNLEEREFPELVLQSIRMWSVPPERVTLEITESTPLPDAAQALAMLQRLKAIGLRIAIDDFGTGYSSLALLREMPVDELKIDQQFVRGMLRSSTSMQIVRSVLDLAKNFGLQSVAEGIEDEATLVALRDLGCRVGQGFHIARPLARDDLIDWLRARDPAAR